MLPFIKKLRGQKYLLLVIPLFVFFVGFVSIVLINNESQLRTYKGKITALQESYNSLNTLLQNSKTELETLQNEDPRKTNNELQAEINNIQTTFKGVLSSFNNLVDLKIQIKNTSALDKQFALVLNQLSLRNYSSASATLTDLDKNIKTENDKLAAAVVVSVPTNAPVNNSPPNSGYSRQTVSTEGTNYLVDIISADLNSTRVIVDTASDSDCSNNCPVKPLAEYVSRSGAYAGVNGSYFCPDTYPDCASKKNSYDTLLMNKNKKYFNSDNNVYSTIPAVIFYGNTFRFVTQSLEWGRDTGVDAVIANHPLLLLNNQIMFSGQGEAKMNIKTVRGFIGATGNTVYIGMVHGATVDQMAKVLHTLGIANALNLDDGGSAALWSGGYKVGPGRNLPNAVLFVKK